MPGVPYEELQSGSTHPVTMTPYHLDPQAIEAQIRLIERDGPLLVGMDELDDCLTAMFGSSATGEVIYQVPEWLQKKLDEDPGWMENEPARLGLLD